MTDEAKASIDPLFNESFELPIMVRVAHWFQERPRWDDSSTSRQDKLSGLWSLVRNFRCARWFASPSALAR